MENELRTLVEADKPENRKKWALRWKEGSRTGKVIGIISPLVPEEVLFAAGILPWRVSGTWNADTPLANVHRPAMTCRFCTHVLESILRGELDFLNGVATVKFDDDFKGLWDVIDHQRKFAFNHIMHIPFANTKTNRQMFTTYIVEFKKAAEELVNSTITDKDLSEAIEVYNTTRYLLRKLYELRKREVPSITGAEVLGITTAAGIMPKDEFNSKLEALLPYLENRKAPLKQNHPRLLVVSDFLDHPGYIELMENAGSVVAMDSLDTGSRYFWNSVDTSLGSPWEALAKRYLDVSSPRNSNWKEQVNELTDWVGEFNIDGVVILRQLYSFPSEFMFTYIVQRLEEAGIPYLSLRREYHLEGVGMLTTRVEAFLEMLSGEAT